MFQPLVDFIQFDFVQYMLISEVFVGLIRIIKLTCTGRISNSLRSSHD